MNIKAMKWTGAVVVLALTALVSPAPAAESAAAAATRPRVEAAQVAIAQHTQRLLGLPIANRTIGRIDFSLVIQDGGSGPNVAGRTLSATGNNGWSVAQGGYSVGCFNNQTRLDGRKYSRCVARLDLRRPGNWRLSASGPIQGVQVSVGYEASTGSSFANHRFTYEVELTAQGYIVFGPNGEILPYYAPPGGTASSNSAKTIKVLTAADKDPLIGTWKLVSGSGIQKLRFTGAGDGYPDSCSLKVYTGLRRVTTATDTTAEVSYEGKFRLWDSSTCTAFEDFYNAGLKAKWLAGDQAHLLGSSSRYQRIG